MSAAPRDTPPERAAQEGLFAAPVRVRFSHCDPAGITYFPRWFDLMNGVVEDWFGQALDLDYRASTSGAVSASAMSTRRPISFGPASGTTGSTSSCGSSASA